MNLKKTQLLPTFDTNFSRHSGNLTGPCKNNFLSSNTLSGLPSHYSELFDATGLPVVTQLLD